MYNQVCKSDLDAALLFFTSLSDDKGIVIQCSKDDDIPYIKRNIRCILGTPDRSVGNVLFYERRPISIVSLNEYESEGIKYSEEQLFFVDVYPIVLSTEGRRFEVPNSMFSIFRSIGLVPCEVVNTIKDVSISPVDIAKGLNDYFC